MLLTEEDRAQGAEGSSSWFDSFVSGAEGLLSYGGTNLGIETGGFGGGLGGGLMGNLGDLGGLAVDETMDAMAPDLDAVNAMIADGSGLGGSFADAVSGMDLSAFGVP
jgi:hypothetical protein